METSRVVFVSRHNLHLDIHRLRYNFQRLVQNRDTSFCSPLVTMSPLFNNVSIVRCIYCFDKIIGHSYCGGGLARKYIFDKLFSYFWPLFLMPYIFPSSPTRHTHTLSKESQSLRSHSPPFIIDLHGVSVKLSVACRDDSLQLTMTGWTMAPGDYTSMKPGYDP